jgi:hypothetical protein
VLKKWIEWYYERDAKDNTEFTSKLHAFIDHIQTELPSLQKFKLITTKNTVCAICSLSIRVVTFCVVCIQETLVPVFVAGKMKYEFVDFSPLEFAQQLAVYVSLLQVQIFVE